MNTTDNQTLVLRLPRQLVEFFNHKTIMKPSISGANSAVNVAIGDSALTKTIDSPAQAGLKVASQLIVDGGELIRTPVKWIKDIQANWLIYIICAAIICLSILFLYCLAQRYIARKQNGKTGFTSQLVDMAMILAHNHQNTNANCTTNALNRVFNYYYIFFFYF
jgi:hypothetical protein